MWSDSLEVSKGREGVLMELDIIALMRNILMTQGVVLYRMEEISDGNIAFDGGIRKQIFEGYDYKKLAGELDNLRKYETVCIVADPFEVSYILLEIPEAYGEDAGCMLIGPYLVGSALNIDQIAQRLGIPLFYVSVMKSYYYGIPTIDNMLSIISLFADNIYGKGGYDVIRTGLRVEDAFKDEVIQTKYRNEIYINEIERRYKQEEKVLEAIRRGDAEKAQMYMGGFGLYKLPERASDALQNNKNICLVLNTLFRKEVQKAKVHPVHIDELSNNFAKRIENGRSGTELGNICSEMVRKYCFLVQNYSLMGYSKIIEQVINYIDFHVQEPLGLQYISNHFNLSQSYLSRLFKKETGKTLTEYINEKRIEDSLIYLVATNLPIQEVAAQVGILDENYFSRIFKKMKHMTPREYRNEMLSEK